MPLPRSLLARASRPTTSSSASILARTAIQRNTRLGRGVGGQQRRSVVTQRPTQAAIDLLSQALGDARASGARFRAQDLDDHYSEQEDESPLPSIPTPSASSSSGKASTKGSSSSSSKPTKSSTSSSSSSKPPSLSALARPSRSRTQASILKAHKMTFTPRPLTAADGPLVWVDLEMTGLDVHTDRILEIAILITNGNLDVVDEEGFRMVVRTEKVYLDNMNEWCITTHGKSGLTAACATAPNALSTVERLALSYIRQWVPDQNVGLLAGSSVHMDRMFLEEWMPSITRWLHYRIVDVSSVKELCRRWFPEVTKAGRLEERTISHRALDDIRASINELKFYREHIFKKHAGQGQVKPLKLT